MLLTRISDRLVLDNNVAYAKPGTAFRMIECSVWNANNIPLSAS